MTTQVPDFQPIIIGADIGAYAIARAVHEGFGLTSICIAGNPPGYVANSSIIDVEKVENTRDTDELVTTLTAIQQRVGKQCVLLTNSDWHATWLTELELDNFAIPYPAGSTSKADKDYFPDHVKNIAAPPQAVIRFDETVEPTRGAIHDFDYPVIAKIAAASQRGVVHYPGEEKVHTLHGVGELQSLIHSLRSAGYQDRIVIQPQIQGDDSHDYSLSAYINRSGEVAAVISGRVVSHDPNPAMIGNPTTIITDYAPDLEYVAQEVATGLELAGCFINMDFKVDAQSGVIYLLDINIRPGRNIHYVTASGLNIVKHAVHDYLGLEPAVDGDKEAILYSLIPEDLLRELSPDSILKAEIHALIDAGKVVNPLEYEVDSNPARDQDLANMADAWRHRTKLTYR